MPLGRFVVPLVEKRIERFEDQCLVRFFGCLRHVAHTCIFGWLNGTAFRSWRLLATSVGVLAQLGLDARSARNVLVPTLQCGVLTWRRKTHGFGRKIDSDQCGNVCR